MVGAQRVRDLVQSGVGSIGRHNTSSVDVSDGAAFGVDDDADWAPGDAVSD